MLFRSKCGQAQYPDAKADFLWSCSFTWIIFPCVTTYVPIHMSTFTCITFTECKGTAFEITLYITFYVSLKKSHTWWHNFHFLCHYRFQFNMRNMIFYRRNKDFHLIQETLLSYSSSGLKKDKLFEIKYYTYGYPAHRCCRMSGGCWYCFSHSGLSNAFLLIWRCSSDWICSRRAWLNCRKLDWVCGIQTKLSSTAKPVDYTNHM